MHASFGVGCGDTTEPGGLCVVDGETRVEIGVPDPVGFILFEPLEAGEDIPLSSNGQTFLAVQLALRAENLGTAAYIEMSVTYTPKEGGPSRTAIKDATLVERLFCRADKQLHVVPVVVSSEALGDDLEIQDKLVVVELSVRDTEGREASARTTGVLRRI